LEQPNRYFIPEDGDEEAHPNVFLAPKPRQPGTPPLLGQVKDSFPLPGHYHFRFKSPLFPGADRDKGAMAVWMDATQDGAPVPTWKNAIIAKVTRLSMEEEDEDDDDADFGDRGVHAATPAPAARPAPPSHHSSSVSAGSGDHLDIFGGPSPSSQAPAPAPVPAATTTPNLFDAHHPPPQAPTSAGGSLLDFGSQPSASPASGVHADFLGMTAPTQHQQQGPPPQAGYPGQGTPNMYPPQHQQQQQQRPPQQQTFDSFNQQQQQQGPFGDLNWK
jgi:hypothetical protein